MPRLWLSVVMGGLAGCGDDGAVGIDAPVDVATDVAIDGPPPVPVTLVTGQLMPTALTVDATHIYWAAEPTSSNAHEIWRVDKSGGTAQRLATTTVCQGPTAIRKLIVSGPNVYWTTKCGVSRVDKTTGGTPTDCTGAAGAQNFTSDGTNLFAAAGNGQISASTIAACAFTTRATGVGNPLGIGVSGANVYFADLTGTTGQLYSMPVSGSTATPIGPAPWTFYVTGDAAGVYWIQGNTVQSDADDELEKYDPGTQQTTTLVPAPVEGALDLVSDGTYLYWVEQGASSETTARIKRVRNDGGAASLVVMQPRGIRAVAVDASSAYWTDYTAGTIMKIALP